MIGLEGSRGGRNENDSLIDARIGEPGVRCERYDVAVPRKSPWPDKCGWAMIEMVIEHLVGSSSGDDEIEY